MIVVVADSSPLNYLVLIDSIVILEQLFEKIVVPVEVIQELRDPRAPSAVRAWAESLPEWIAISSLQTGDSSEMPDLDAGERAAILLAQNHAGALLLIDDGAGRREAAQRGLQITGTLGVLREAALNGLIDLPTSLAKLLETNFRISQTLVGDLLVEDAKRPRSG